MAEVSLRGSVASGSVPGGSYGRSELRPSRPESQTANSGTTTRTTTATRARNRMALRTATRRT